MNLVSIVILLQVLSISLCIETDIVKLLKKEKEYMSLLEAQNESVDTKSKYTKAKNPKKYTPTSDIKGKSVDVNNTDKITKYIEHMKRRGIRTLKYIERDIIKEMRQINVTEKINDAINNYITYLQNYCDYITGPKSVVIIDKEFIFLDICETACRTLYHEQRIILNHIVGASNLTKIVDDVKTYTSSVEKDVNIVSEHSSEKLQVESIKNITETIFSYNTDLRKKEIKYICKKYNICRPYPALTDYCGYFVSEILRLPSNKFVIITKLINVILGINENITAVISEVTNFQKFTRAAFNVCEHETTTKEKLIFFKAVLSQKFNIINNPDLNFKMRAPALRVLFDIVDSSFIGEQHDEFIKDFDTTVKAIQKWANNEINSIAIVVGKFFERLFKILNNILHSDAKQHILILIEMIKEGNSAQYFHKYEKAFR